MTDQKNKMPRDQPLINLDKILDSDKRNRRDDLSTLINPKKAYKRFKPCIARLKYVYIPIDPV